MRERLFEPHTVPNLLNLKKETTNMILQDVSQDPDEGITELESMKVLIDRIDSLSKMTDHDLMMHIIKAYLSRIIK